MHIAVPCSMSVSAKPSASQCIVCSNCQYDANPPTARYCKACGYWLGDNTQSLIARRNWLHSGFWLVTLLSLSLSGYVLWQGQANAPKSASSLTASTDIQFYPSLRAVQNVPRGVFNYAGAVTFANLTAHGMHDEITKAHPSFRLRYTESPGSKPGTGTAITLLLNKQTTFAQTARPLKSEEIQQAQARGFTLEQIPVFLDGIAFYIHPDLQIPGLSLNQAQAIFKGEVRNWKQVGGPDLLIKPFSQDPKASSVISIILGDEEKLGANVEIIYNITDAIRKVAKNPGGISYGSPSLIIDQKSVRPLALAATGSRQYISFLTDAHQINKPAFQNGTYPLTRRLFVVFRRDGTPDEKVAVAYTNFLLSQEGQNLIEQAGFVSIY
jgi:phosphate transport system substrate-binding protein